MKCIFTDKFQLTSVKVVPEVYKQFKMKCLDTGLTLQELVNISLILYNKNNNGYDKMIHEEIKRSLNENRKNFV